MGRQDEPAFLASTPVPGSTGKLADGTGPNVALKSDGSTTVEGELVRKYCAVASCVLI